MSAERPDASARNRLFVEGSDDLYVVIELVKAHGIAWTGSDGRIPMHRAVRAIPVPFAGPRQRSRAKASGSG